MAKAEKTLADFVVIAISPLLIMALVGSLVFFLAEVLYVGQYEGSLRYILFLFVFGAVLVARIAIEQDEGRAAIYGLVLAVAAWCGMLRYVEYPPGTFAADFGWGISLVLIAIIWWSSNKLTWDCTMIDDKADASGSGLMQAAGLEEDAEPGKDKKRSKKSESGLAGWWQRYQQYREERRRRPHVPGVWVVYFSLAALPLYGLGQSLIPTADEERRRYAFWLMSIYVGSGLGLLLTTSFLGLRRYLRQKKVQMPHAMTGVWLLLGAALIAGFLVVGALLPRPAAEYALIDLPWRAGSRERDASRFAKQGDAAGKGEGRPGAEGKEDEEGAGKDGKGKGGSSSSSKKDAKGGAEGKGKGGEKGSTKDKESGAKDRSDKKENDGEGKHDADKPGDVDRAPPAMPEWTTKLGTFLKWIVLGIFGLVIGFFLLRALLTFLANFTGWAKNLLDFFRNWWQGWTSAEPERPDDVAASSNAMPAPFRTFRDPFLTGEAVAMSTADLVRYTFEALQSWAAERDLPRQGGETALEFAERLARAIPEMADEVRRLAKSYGGLAYSGQTLSDDCREPLRGLWQMLAETGAIS